MTVSMIVVLALFVVVAHAAYPTPPPTFDAKTYTTWAPVDIHGSRKATIYVPFNGTDFVSMARIDLVGDAYTRGFAHGALLVNEITAFIGPELDQFFRDKILNIDLDKLKEPWRTLLKLLQPYLASKAPEVFAWALNWVFSQEVTYIPQESLDEMRGIADGVCSQQGNACNATAVYVRVRAINLLPELIQMTCTSFGAWDSASSTGGLIHLRALDFGGGPFANRSTLIVHRDPNNPNKAFAALGFPAFVGVITGISQSGVGVSEKVWETYNDFPASMQSGWYNGTPDVLVLRHILEHASTRQEAEQYMNNAHRTFGMWVGVGDYASQRMDIIGYRANSSVAYNDVTMPGQTGQPFIMDVVYVDKHPQPSHDGPTGSLPTSLQALHGSIGLDTAKQIVQNHQTGDLHWAAYDYKNKILEVAVGRTDANGNYGPTKGSDEWCAYNRPSVLFNLSDLWAGL